MQLVSPVLPAMDEQVTEASDAHGSMAPGRQEWKKSD
jgi:hypothetical protein